MNMECKSEDTDNTYGRLPRDREVFFIANLDEDVPVGSLSGYDRFLLKKLNKSTAFTHRERQLLHIHGLLPYAVETIDTQVQRCTQYLDTQKSEMDKLNFLWTVECRNVRLFYKILLSDVDKFAPILTCGIFTTIISMQPFISVGKVLYVNIRDKGHVYEVLKNWPERNVLNILVTDGEQVQSAIDLGVNSAAVAIATMQSTTLFAGLKPTLNLPIVLDVGTNNNDLLNDANYVGLRERRVKGKEYYEFIDEFMMACVRRWGQRALVMFNDFSLLHSIKLLDRYKKAHCCMNIDMQVCGASGLAGIIASKKITRIKFRDNIFMFFGFRAPNMGFAELCYLLFKKEGLIHDDIMKRIWFCDQSGLLTKSRKAKLHPSVAKYAHNHEPIETLEEAIMEIKPNILIGCSGIAGAFTKPVLNAMEQINEIPIIMALSRPKEMLECTPEQAYAYTKGRCLYASSTIFPPLKYGNKMYLQGFSNVSTIVAGVTMGVMCSGMVTLPNEIFIVAAERLADLVPPEVLAQKGLYPLMKNIKCCSLRVAEAIMGLAYRRKWAALWPEPKNRMDYINSQLFDFDYQDSIPETYCVRPFDIGTKESLKNYPPTTQD